MKTGLKFIDFASVLIISISTPSVKLTIGRLPGIKFFAMPAESITNGGQIVVDTFIGQLFRSFGT